MRSLKEHTDNELFGLMQAGDHAAFTEIYTRYSRSLYLSAYKVCGRREDSTDVCQSLFVWLWEQRDTIRITSNLKGFLHTVIKYKVANLIRHGKVRETLFDELQEVDSRTYQNYELELKELRNLIDQLIHELPPRCREVFLLSRYQHLSHKEIARQLNLSEKTVDEQINRALKKLRAPLGRLASIFLFF